MRDPGLLDSDEMTKLCSKSKMAWVGLNQSQRREMCDIMVYTRWKLTLASEHLGVDRLWQELWSRVHCLFANILPGHIIESSAIMNTGSQYYRIQLLLKPNSKRQVWKLEYKFGSILLLFLMVQSDFCRRIITKEANRDNPLKDNIYTIAKLSMMIGRYQWWWQWQRGQEETLG